MKKRFNKIWIVFAVVVISLIFAPSKEERQAEDKAEIKKLTQEISKLSPLNVEENLYRYNRLSQLEPKNKSYSQKFKELDRLSSVESVCRQKARDQDIRSLTNPETYEGLEENRVNKWLSKSVFVTSSSFKGSSLLNKVHVFRSEYKCTLTSEGVRIKRTSLRES